jgi:hypothetical protein
MSYVQFKAGGALTDKHADVYVKRTADTKTIAHLRKMDYLLVVEPRQQGKTSLINYLMRQSGLDDAAFVYLDVTTLDRSSEASWYKTLCPRILRQLCDFIPRDQRPYIPQNSAGWREFLCEVALCAVDARRRVVIALDEIGAVTFPGATEFFTVLRDVYNSRQAESELQQITFLLAGAFHPRDLITDDKISPFNIAERVRLCDFDRWNVNDLVKHLLLNHVDRFGEFLSREDDFVIQVKAISEQIIYWVGGQPYLTQWICRYLTQYGPAVKPEHVNEAIERLRRDDDNHIPPILRQLKADEKLCNYLKRIMAGEQIRFYPRENRRQAQLELLGVIKEDPSGFCVIRNRIYKPVLLQALGILESLGSKDEKTVSLVIPSHPIGDKNMDYERGLDALKKLAEGTDWYQDFTVQEAPLRENLSDERRYGPSEQTRRDRTRIVDRLNAVALKHVGISFNELCLGMEPASTARLKLTDEETIERLRRIEEKLDRGRTEDRQTADQILDAVTHYQVTQAEVTQMVTELRQWAKAVQQAGIPLDSELQEALEELSEHKASAYQYLQLALPIIPGILSYNVELGSEHQLDLKTLWNRFKARVGRKDAKGDGSAPTSAEEALNTGTAWAVLVGVNEYDDKANYGQLQVCVKDVGAIWEQLVGSGFDPARIRILTDHTNEPPTRANVLTALKAVADATEPNDLLLFYYSGHGEEDGGESYLIARDGRRLVLSDTAVPLSRIKEIVEEAPARAKVIMLDACHSGADIGGKGPEPMSEAFIRRVFEEAEGIAILASCKQGQLSYEWRDNERSVFTHFLLEALAGQADWDEKGFVTVQDASRHVTNGVKLWASQRNTSQTPTLQYAVAGDIILVNY